jgi:hypothetical protein
MIAIKNTITPIGNCDSLSGLSNVESNNNITTHDNTPVNQQIAVTKTLELLRQSGYSYTQQLDWIALSPNRKWLCVEVKYKSRLFHPPPFWGIGLDLSQVFLRNKVLEFLSIPTFLIVYVEEQPYGQYLDILGNGKKYKTEKDILVFPIEAFLKGEDAILRILNGGEYGS